MAATGYPLLPTLTLDKWYWILLLSMAIPLLGDLGDLSLSLIKRHWKIKDFGSILPGHGGILDRVDSDMFVCVGLAIIVIFITNGWNIAI
jgi:phosphatidate cytidylyltransferase